MSKQLTWKINKEKNYMVGLYKETPLYEIGIVPNKLPTTVEEIKSSVVEAKSTEMWGVVCETKGFSKSGISTVGSIAADYKPVEVNSSFKERSHPIRKEEEAVKFMKELRKVVDIDFGFKIRHVEKSNEREEERRGQ